MVRPLLQFLETLLLKKTAQTPMLTRKHFDPYALENGATPGISDIVMCSFCLLASMELILIPNNSLLYLHSNDMNSLKSVFLKRRGKRS